MVTPAITGLFFWGVQLSSQILLLIATNLVDVLSPGLARLKREPERQYQATCRTLRNLVLLLVPLCIVQFTLARPLILLLFDAEWHRAIPVA